MPTLPTYPGVYIEELPSGVHTITGVATSIAAFIGRARRGATDKPVRVQSFADFEREFGGLWALSEMSFAVQHFFLNGGRDAIIVRVHKNATRANVTIDGLTLDAASEGLWGSQLRVRIDHDTRDHVPPGEAADELFNIAFQDETTKQTERFVNVSTRPLHPRYVKAVLELGSKLARVTGPVPSTRPTAHNALANPTDDPFAAASSTQFTGTTTADGDEIDAAHIIGGAGDTFQANKQGLWRLEHSDLFNLLCIPPFGRETDVHASVWAEALRYCEERRAMLIVDPPWQWADVTAPESNLGSVVSRSKNAAFFFPGIKVANPLNEYRLSAFAPCGAVAGVFARTDSQRGVWKAPAGTEATLAGVADLSVNLTDVEQGRLNPLAVNCLRSFPVVGRVVWGSRTMVGADRLGSEWKYVPVRRLALFIEESLFRGTEWVVFEPNDEPLWAQIRLNVGTFMHDLFRQGAFQGSSPRDAYFVKCSKETTPQSDIDKGIVNILVGFAPLQPAEFVIIKIQQKRDQQQP